MMMLPKNEKVHRDGTKSIKIWVYGEPNIGKTTFANQFPNALMINTDGNIKYVDSPAVDLIGDGKSDPWENFVNYCDEFLKGGHGFDTIVIDLVEDVYQYARAYYCKKLKVEHEGDLGFAKGYDIVRNGFLYPLRKLANSEYNVVFISHEMANVVKDRVGRETTTFAPNITEKVAKKISGMVEITGRISVKSKENEDGTVEDKRIIYLNSTKDQFCGNKIPTIKDDFIELGYENLVKAIKGGE